MYVVLGQLTNRYITRQNRVKNRAINKQTDRRSLKNSSFFKTNNYFGDIGSLIFLELIVTTYTPSLSQ